MKRTATALFGLCLWTAGAPVQGYSPPVDTAGPLTVRIDGPEVVTQTETPLPVRVLLENQGDAPLEGTLQLGLVDAWRAEPGQPVRFSVGARSKAGSEFQVVAGKETCSAHYPIHAVARFELDGKPYTAHPILILETKLPPPSQPGVPLQWKPLKVPAAGSLALCGVPLRRTIVQVFGQQPLTMPVGWQGSEPQSRATTQLRAQTLSGQTREAIVMHPPWYQQHAGTVLVEYPLDLPETAPLKLRFANAVTPTGRGDGVTFRVRVLPLDAPAGALGKVVFQQHTASRSWQPSEADLSAFAGQAVRVQLESHPGPRSDTGWDESYWAEPTLAAGTPPEPRPFPPSDTTGSRLLGTLKGRSSQYDVRIWPGQRGLLDAAVGFTCGRQRLLFRGFEVRVLQTALHDPGAPILLHEAKQEPCESGYQVRHRFEGLWGAFDLVGRVYLEGETLRVKFHLDNAPAPRPWLAVYLEDVAAGPWSLAAPQIYAGQGNVIRDPQAFRLQFDGHQLATSFVGFDFSGGPSIVQASDLPPKHLEVDPAGRRYSLHVPHEATLTFAAAENVWEAVKVWRSTNGLRPAGGVRKAAGRFVFDLWGGRYGPSAEALERAFRYGLGDSLVVWHNWQRWGYDYRLPDIYPPNPGLGTLQEMQALIQTCRQAGALIAVHDNYIDFYPDADGFSYDKCIAFRAPGEPVLAWLNEGRSARSYRFRADQVEPFLQRNLQLVRGGLAPSAYFIDVWSSVCPYDYWTADGRFFTRVFTRDTWRRHFAWIRDFLGDDAPQISESGHDQLIGWLDGAQSNHLRVGKPLPGKRGGFVWKIECADAERIAWLDAAHHDRFVLHGAGYSSRYEAGLEPQLHGIYSDDYMATEVLTGHPAMVSQPFGRDVVRKYWLLHDLGRALALRTIEDVQFVGGDLHRQHVRWSGQGEVWVNRGQSDWVLPAATLPQYGFLAQVPTDQGPVEVSLSRREGVVVETARSPEALYVNARQPPASRSPDAQAVDFGPVITAGGCRLTRQGSALLVAPLPAPAGAKFTARLRWAALPWPLPKPAHIETLSEDGKVLSRQPLRREGEQWVIECPAEAYACRLVGEQESGR